MRVGIGYDVHALRPGRPLILCGTTIPHHSGPEGHSDADVAAHATMDALLGAAALGDIGQHFPDTDPAYCGADSMVLLERVRVLLGQEGYAIGNIDLSLCLQSPRISPYIPQMRQVLCRVLQLPAEAVSVKATTTDRLGFVGREEGVAALAVAMIHKISASA